MLKSHFNLQKDEEEEQNLEEEHSELIGEALAEEEKVVYAERKLNKSEVSIRLSMLGKTADGDGYTYLKATCTKMNLTDIKAIKCFKHLQFVNVSENYLDLDALQIVTELPFLVLIHADKNILHSAALKRMKYLQVIIINYNSISNVHDVYQPELSTLEVGYNKIRNVYFDNKMPNLRCIDFRYNLIQDISDFDFPNLVSLYLAGNKISSLVGIEKLVNLRILHVRNNPIKLLNGFDSALAKLQYINLRNCQVTTLKQVKKLKFLESLDTLILKGCPYMGGTGEENAEVVEEEDDAELRVEVLAALPRLKRFNKGVVTPEERNCAKIVAFDEISMVFQRTPLFLDCTKVTIRQEAKDLMAQWLEEGEKDEEEIEDEHQEDSNLED